MNANYSNCKKAAMPNLRPTLVIFKWLKYDAVQLKARFTVECRLCSIQRRSFPKGPKH